MGDASIQIISSGPASLPALNPTKSYWQTSYPNPVADHRSTSSLPSKATVVIVGTGICGVFAAHEILTQSADVDILVLEARTVCSAATGRNGGHLVPIIHEQRPGIIAWELRNFHHVEGLIEAAEIPCDFRKLNGCIGFWNKTYFDEAKAALKEATAIAPEQTSKGVRVVEDASALEALNLVGAVGALVQTTAASLSPYKLVTKLWQDLLDKHEGTVRLNLQTTTPVTSLSYNEAIRSYLITTDRGNVSASHVILATNGYTSHLLPQFSSLITPRQAQMSAQLPPKDSPFSKQLIPQSYGFLGIPGMDREMSDYLVQQPLLEKGTAGAGGELMYGGGRQAARGNGVLVSDDSYVDPEVEQYLRRLPERLNLRSSSPSDGTTPTNAPSPIQLELLASWTGIIGSSVDGYPWVGGVPEHPGLFLAGGYSGHGMPNAPLSGRHVARLVLESLKGGDWARLQRTEVELTEQGGGSAANNNDHKNNFGVPVEYVITKERIEKALGSA
jgi:glycine/D-amino acid oxidase-like deaminating enzyme